MAPDHVFRRRRAGAGIGLIAIVALLIAAIGSHGSSKRSSRPDAHHLNAPPLSAAQRAAANASAEQNAIDSVLAYTPAVTSGGAHGDEVALTFDDGPGPYTQRLVATLDRLRVHATFFAIGDHTETHPMMASLTAHEQYEELFDQMAQIEGLGGPRPRLFRPPYGSFNETTFKEL